MRFIAITLLALLAGCNAPTTPETAAAPQKHSRPAHRVEVAVAALREAAVQHRRTGTLAPVREVRVLAREEGTVLSIAVHEGAIVQEGQALARLDDGLLRAQLRKAAALRGQAQQDLARLEKLRPTNLASEDELARARTVLETARAEEELLQLRVNRTAVSSPLTGVVTQRMVEPGDVVVPMTHLFTVADNRAFEVRLPVAEQLVPLLRKGDSVPLMVDNLGEPLDGTVARIHPAVDPATRQGLLEVVVDPAPAGLVPGQLVRAIISGRDQPKLAIPFEALRRDNRGEFVFRLDGSTVVKTPVVSGIHLDSGIEIRTGLKAGDRVVIRGFLGIEDGKRVVVNDAAADD